ncbi:MAG: 6-carboxytetrahydropterin synthase QueD [Candidatus Eremiobacteraeota bacterium]|nr:6-carboxytetrahydropterin synthase QueD [Candidatus Eremiobacteraeota bacterium]
MQIRKHFKFEAAHVLPHHPGKCGRLHGHSYRLEIAVAGPLQSAGPARGMVVDFDELSSVVRTHAIERLDHISLNDLMPNPTAEHIALWIWDELSPHLPQLVEIVVWETQTACAVVGIGDAGAR